MIEKFIERAEKICSSDLSQEMKNYTLGCIMTEMEVHYHIPMMRCEVYNQEHPEIMEAYRKIAYMRRF